MYASHDQNDLNKEDKSLQYHNPVMVEECLDALAIKKDGLYVDCTLGGGGHTKCNLYLSNNYRSLIIFECMKGILQRGGMVLGLDQDPEAINTTTALLNEYITSGKLEILQSNFRSIEAALKSSTLCSERGSQLVDGVLMDLGVSSHQINEPNRGFAFGSNGPLDMRMSGGNFRWNDLSTFPVQLIMAGNSASSITAATICNEWSVNAIADALYAFGDEKRSRQIAREIVYSRPLNTTGKYFVSAELCPLIAYSL